MITFNDIYEASRKERYSEKLQDLPENFIQEVADYLKEKREISLKNDDAFSDVVMKTKKQLENANTLFKELMNRRKKKILNLILIATETGISKKDFDNMLDFEKKLFEELMKCVDVSDNKISEAVSGKPKNGENMQRIFFKEGVGELAGLNGEQIGPFKKDQSAELPKEIAKILIESGKAEPAS